eukprot:3385958-Rhodomonas_salina.1
MSSSLNRGQESQPPSVTEVEDSWNRVPLAKNTHILGVSSGWGKLLPRTTTGTLPTTRKDNGKAPVTPQYLNDTPPQSSGSRQGVPASSWTQRKKRSPHHACRVN